MTIKKKNLEKSTPDQGNKLQQEIKKIETEFIVKALNEADRNIERAASILGISSKLLIEKMKELGISG